MQYDLTSADWHKSSYSGNSGNCVEARNLPNVVAVRDSKDPGPILTFSPEMFGALITAIKDGEFSSL